MSLIVNARQSWRVALALCLLLLAGSAWAQDANMTLYVFKKGLPQPNIEILLDEQLVGVTDENGVIRFDMNPGIRYLEIRDQDLTVLAQQLLVNQDEISQWIVNLTEGLGALVDRESSAGGVAGAGVAAAATQATGGPGTLSGLLISADDGKPLEGARVFISGQPSDIRTGPDGTFEIEVPSGEYSLSILHATHNTLTQDGIEVVEGEETPLEFRLTPAGSELPEFVVIEPYIEGSLASVLEERRSELAVANILGAEQISKAGDSTAAGALRRVTGLTLVDGQFIYVRGLGERYSSTLLNGANIPSPDPTRRVVPLDLFPTNIVKSIAVKKGYTGDLPGEFGGGAVELRTKNVPESPFLTFEVSLGYRDGTSFEDGLRYDGGGRDWTGRDDGTRAQSPELQDAIGDGSILRPFNRFTGVGFQPEELEVIGESLPVNYDVYEESLPLNFDAGIAGGYVWEFDGGQRFGLLAATEYKDDWLNVEEQRTDFRNSDAGLISENDFTFLQTFRRISYSFFVTSGFEFNENHNINYNWMILRNTTDRAQVEQGFNVDAEGGDVLFREMEWVERELKANQFFGEHILPSIGGLKFNWQYTDANAGSDEPDTRRYRYDPDRRTPEEDDFIFSLRNDSNQRRWSELQDESVSWNMDFALPLDFDTEAVDFTVRTGLSGWDKDRDSSIRRFTFFSRGRIGSDLDTLRLPSLEDIIFDETIDPDGWQLEEVTNSTDAYTGSQKVDAWHVGLDLALAESWQFSAGFRDEQSFLQTTTSNIFDPDGEPILTTQSTDDIFPYGTMTWIAGDHQVRAGYAETINRPDFKELSPSQYRDPLLDRFVQGNPNLVPAFITHYDIRWDYYFNPGEFISFGVFLKEFDQPIEQVILASAGARLTTFDNAETAENFGFEFEFYKTFDFVDDWWEWGEIWGNFYLNTNYAWIESEITLPEGTGIQTNANRPLQGQSPYVWNFQIGYDDPERKINAALLYNVFGERIVEVGVAGAPDIYEQPRPSLDFVYAQNFGPWRFKGSLKNILNPERELTQGEAVTRLTQPVGWELSLGVQYTFQ